MFNNILQTIGNTPMVKINNFELPEQVRPKYNHRTARIAPAWIQMV